MRLAHPQMDSVLDFDKGHVNTLVIEHPSFFRELLQDVQLQLQGYPGKTVLSEDDEPLDFAKSAEIIDSFLSFQIGRKQLISKIISRLEATAVSEAYYSRTAEMVSGLEQYIMELAFDLPCDVSCGKISFSGVLRSVGIEIPDDYENDLERFLDYMELTRELERDKLFIFVNLRSYYEDSQMEAFFRTALGHGFRILLVDSVSRSCLPSEKRVTIDGDLCEF